MRLQIRTAVIVSVGFLIVVFFGTIIFANAGTVKIANTTASGYETIASGSYIIDRCQATQIRAKALFTYGLVYE